MMVLNTRSSDANQVYKNIMCSFPIKLNYIKTFLQAILQYRKLGGLI